MPREIRGWCAACHKQVLLRYHDPVTEDYLIPHDHHLAFGPQNRVRCEGSDLPAREEETAHS